jgi:outer membrane receptor for ferric coprogen and ferric-rhodotorulic acid
MYAFTGGAVSSTGATSLRSAQRDFDQDTFSLDASYSQPFETFGHVSEFVVGSDYKHYDTNTLIGATNFGAINVQSYTPGQFAKRSRLYNSELDTQSEELGLYSKVTLRPIADLALIGGARLGWYKGTSDTTTFATATAAQRTVSSDQRHSGYVTPYGGLVYDLDTRHSLYASYSQVYKPQDATGVDGQVLKPREGEQYELGIKGSYWNGDLNARFTVFQLTDKNRSSTVYDSAGVAISGYTEASGKSRVRGAEVEISGALTPQWDILAGYTYMKTEDLSGDVTGTFTAMPRHQASVWSKYTLASGALSGLSLGAGVSGMSDFYMQASGSAIRVNAPGYATVDAKLSYPVTRQLTATLDANNLFDREYYSRVGSVATFNFYGPSRSFTVGARYDF